MTTLAMTAGGLAAGTVLPSGSSGGEGHRGAGLDLQELRARYRSDLFDSYLPHLERYVIDPEFGGSLCTVDIRNGERLSEERRTWYEARGLWVWSFLYNRLDNDERWLELARSPKELLLRHRPDEGGYWPARYTRSGEVVPGSRDDLQGVIYVAEALGEYALATSDEALFDEASQLLSGGFDRYLLPDYRFRDGAPGIRYLGHWMAFLNAATLLMQARPDAGLLPIADRCLAAILEEHLHPEYGLLNEELNGDGSRPENGGEFVFFGHALETLWMVMHEAARRRDKSLFRQAADLFRYHVEVSGDPVYGGSFRSLEHVPLHQWRTEKILWQHEEILIGAMMMIEQEGDPWAALQFRRTSQWMREAFFRADYRFPIANGDRRLVSYNGQRAENYHHPRHLMLNLLAIERMLGNES